MTDTETTTVTVSAEVGTFAKGARALVGRHRAVVQYAEATTLTVAYRDAWYWRAAWRLEDGWRWLTSRLAALLPPR